MTDAMRSKKSYAGGIGIETAYNTYKPPLISSDTSSLGLNQILLMRI